MPRLKSCQYCGRIHKSDYDCGKKPIRGKHSSASNASSTNANASNANTIRTSIESFRSSSEWKNKRADIRVRDNGVCRVCLANKRITQDCLSVHHIVPLVENFELRLDDSNLITLCGKHHELAESGLISREELSDLAATNPSIT